LIQNYKSLNCDIMKRSITIIGMLAALILISNEVTAQESSNQDLTMGIPEVCLIATVNNLGVAAATSLELTTSTAGLAISGGTGFSYAIVSSIVNELETRTITASVTGVPAGTTLEMAASIPSSGNQAGTLGTGTASQLLSGTAVDAVTGIGSMYTGTSSGDGYKLDYTWDAGASGSYGTIFATGGATATVVLTLSAGF
jgi:hypothetical protein